MGLSILVLSNLEDSILIDIPNTEYHFEFDNYHFKCCKPASNVTKSGNQLNSPQNDG